MDTQTRYLEVLKAYRLLVGLPRRPKVLTETITDLEREIRRLLNLLIEDQVAYGNKGRATGRA